MVIAVIISPEPNLIYKKNVRHGKKYFQKMFKLFFFQKPLSFFQRHNAAFLTSSGPWLGLPLAQKTEDRFTFTQKTERSQILSLSLQNVYPPNFTEI
jgi:hypothetical protein